MSVPPPDMQKVPCARLLLLVLDHVRCRWCLCLPCALVPLANDVTDHSANEALGLAARAARLQKMFSDFLSLRKTAGWSPGFQTPG